MLLSRKQQPRTDVRCPSSPQECRSFICSDCFCSLYQLFNVLAASSTQTVYQARGKTDVSPGLENHC